ncbi:MAG: hypothetical protein HFH85_15120 [Lachnospiraceae bacterium]|jgi:hypothetical protein|nr:hypothetical protein [Lachnospiraceae bacterium]
MDIIKMAADALEPLQKEGIPVQQGWYDGSRKLHVTLWNLGEYEGAHSDDAGEIEVASVQVNIWSGSDQVKLKKRIRRLMKKAGFCYMDSRDELETDTKVFINALRFMAAQEMEEEADE